MKKIVLNFGCKNSEIKNLAAALISLELISANEHIELTKSKRANILIQIRSGHPVGCKVILKKRKMYDFFLKLLREILSNRF